MIGLVVGAVFATLATGFLAFVFFRLARREEEEAKRRPPPEGKSDG
jgi:hypothetical protein